MAVPVQINGAGPFPFVIDTGAQRTVLSRQLAGQLSLTPGTRIEVHGFGGAKAVGTAVVANLTVNSLTMSGIEAPLLDHRDIGAAGMLGLDALKSQRIVIDFKAGTMTVSPSKERQEKWDGEVIVVTARSRLGQLVLTDAAVDGEHVDVIIDTGGQLSVGNLELRRRLFARERNTEKWRALDLMGVTGGRVVVDYTTVNRLRIAGLNIQNLPMAFADAHVFRTLGLRRSPALLF